MSGDLDLKIVIDVGRLGAVARAWAEAPALAQREMTAATWEAELLLQREIQEHAPVGATSAYRQSITAQEPQLLSDQVIGIVSTNSVYALPLELGTGPRTKFPPIEPLEDWVRAKLDIGGKEAERVAFMIARKIKRSGTKGQHVFENAFTAQEAQVQRIFDAANARIAAALEAGGAA